MPQARPLNAVREGVTRPKSSVKARPVTGREHAWDVLTNPTVYIQSPSISHPPEEQVSLPCCTVALEYSCSPLFRSRTY